jgi:hypothetical protein
VTRHTRSHPDSAALGHVRHKEAVRHDSVGRQTLAHLTTQVIHVPRRLQASQHYGTGITGVERHTLSHPHPRAVTSLAYDAYLSIPKVIHSCLSPPATDPALEGLPTHPRACCFCCRGGWTSMPERAMRYESNGDLPSPLAASPSLSFTPSSRDKSNCQGWVSSGDKPNHTGYFKHRNTPGESSPPWTCHPYAYVG